MVCSSLTLSETPENMASSYQTELLSHITTINDGIIDTNITIYGQLKLFKECLQTLISDNTVTISRKFAILNDYYHMAVHIDDICTNQVTLLYFVLHQIKRNKMDPNTVNLCWETYGLLLENDALPSITPLRTSNNKAKKKKHKYIYSFQLCRVLRLILDKCDDVSEVQNAQRIIQTLQHSCDKNGNALLPSVLTYIRSKRSDTKQIVYLNGIYDDLPSFDVLQAFINSKFFHNEYFPLMECYDIPSFRDDGVWWSDSNKWHVMRRWSVVEKSKIETEEAETIVKDLVRSSNALWNILFIRDLFGEFMYKQMFNTLQRASIELHDDCAFPILYDNVIHAVLSYWFKSDFLFLYEDETESIMLRTILSNIHKMDNKSIHWFLDHSIESMLEKHKGSDLKLESRYYFKLYNKKTYSLEVLERLLPFFIPTMNEPQAIMLLAKGIQRDCIVQIFSGLLFVGRPAVNTILWLEKNKYNDCCNLFELIKHHHYKQNRNVKRTLIYFAGKTSPRATSYNMKLLRLLFNHFYRHFTDKSKAPCLWDNVVYFLRQLLLKKNQKKNKFGVESYISRIFACKNVDAFEMLVEHKFLNVIKLIKHKHINEMMKLLIPRVVIECDDSNVAFFEQILHWMVSKRNDKNRKWIKKFFRIWINNAEGCEDQRWHDLLLKCNAVFDNERQSIKLISTDNSL
eukprot:216406_1